MWQQSIDSARESLARFPPLAGECLGCGAQRALCSHTPGAECAQVGVGRIEEIELSSGFVAGGEHLLQAGTVLSSEAEQQVAPTLNKGEPLGVLLNRAGIFSGDPGQLGKVGVPRVE